LSASFDKENIKPSRLSTPTDLKVIDIFGFGFRLGLTNLFDDDSVSSFAVTYRRSSAFDKAYTRDKETAATALATEGDFNDTLRSAIDSEVSRDE
jgi:hypothetical protein